MVREKIRASQLINALQNHVLGKKLMIEPSQVTAALGLLKKCIPDLSATELSGGEAEDGTKEPIRVIFGS